MADPETIFKSVLAQHISGSLGSLTNLATIEDIMTVIEEGPKTRAVLQAMVTQVGTGYMPGV